MKALHIETPVFYSNYISKSINKKVYLKMECFQETGSFKIRGLGYLCQQEYNQGKQKFISSSGGNAGFAVTWAGMKIQIPVDVYVPETTPETTQAFLRNRGAQVFVAGREWDDTHKLAVQAAENEHAAFDGRLAHLLEVAEKSAGAEDDPLQTAFLESLFKQVFRLQQRHEIVALEGAELGGERVRPGLRAALEAVEEQSLERAADARAGLAQDAAERLIKVERDGVGVHFVDLEAVALGHGGMIRRTR